MDHSCCLGDKRIFRPDISGKKGVFFPSEQFEGFSATWFPMGNPAEMTMCGRATKLNDLLVRRVTEHRRLVTSSDQCESARFVDF